MLGYLGEDKQSFEFSIFYSPFTRHSFHRIWKNIVFEDPARLLAVPERFDSKRWSLEYQGVHIMPRSAISPWERLSFKWQLFQRKRPEHFTCFLFIDVIIYIYVVLRNVPLIKNCCCFGTVLKCSLKSVLKCLKVVYPRQDKLQNAAQRRCFFSLPIFISSIKHYNNIIPNSIFNNFWNNIGVLFSLEEGCFFLPRNGAISSDN